MSALNTFDFVLIGGGIVGTATAYKLSLQFPGKTIALIEKENSLASHQTGRNSGVIHSGIYYKPGSLKAENCRVGREQLVEFSINHGIAHRICGKMIVATNEREVLVLNEIFANGLKNKTPGIKLINAADIEMLEPSIKGLKAIWVPSAGIIDYVAVAKKFMELVLVSNDDNRLFLNEHVIDLKRVGEETEVISDKQRIKAGKVIVCGGLFSDRLAKIDDIKLDMQIVGFRGDYYELLEHAKYKVNNLIYPVPDPKYPFLGVHYTPMIGGEVECGPNAVFTFKREGYSKTSFNWKDSIQALQLQRNFKAFCQKLGQGN